DRCLQLHGGYGYMAEFPIARAWLDARVTRIYGGTTEIMKEVVGRSRGLRPARPAPPAALGAPPPQEHDDERAEQQPPGREDRAGRPAGVVGVGGGELGRQEAVAAPRGTGAGRRSRAPRRGRARRRPGSR